MPIYKTFYALLVFAIALSFLGQSYDSEAVSEKEEPKGPLMDDVKMVTRAVPPVGSIIAWHKNIAPNSPLKLPEEGGWVECNGPIHGKHNHPLADSNGVINVPNLNGTPEVHKADGFFSEGGSFLRGGKTSGIPQSGTKVHGIMEIGDTKGELYVGTDSWNVTTQKENIDALIDSDGLEGRRLIDPPATVNPSFGYNEAYSVVQDSSDGTDRQRFDAYIPRPVNMSVVWIMRIE